jgi:acetamidase/formamidase
VKYPTRGDAIVVFVLFTAASGRIALGQVDAARIHQLAANPKTVVVGYFDAHARPVLKIASGDIVDVETLITSDPEELEKNSLPSEQVQASLRDISAQVTEKGPGDHILTGPIYIEGAEAGDVLEVRLLAIELAIPYGYQACSEGWTFVPQNCQEPKFRIIRLDRDKMSAQIAPGIVIPLNPFFGIMGVAPVPAAGRISSNPPGAHGGNLDNKRLVAGTTLYLPIRAEGALFEIGDGHAAQGDGETGGTALETSLRGRLQFIVRKDMHLRQPRAETPTEFITMGADADLTKAAKMAVQDMIDFLMDKGAVSRSEANRIAGIAADLHVSEVADEKVAAYMTVPKKVFKGDAVASH